MNLVRAINQVNICHSYLDLGCELAGGELVVGSSERIFSHRLPEGGSLPPPSLHRSHQASHCSSASLWGVIAVRRYQPRLTHTHTLDSKAGSASDNGGSRYRTVAAWTCTGSAAYTHRTISTHTLDAGYCVPVTRTPDPARSRSHGQTRAVRHSATVEESSSGGKLQCAQWRKAWMGSSPRHHGFVWVSPKFPAAASDPRQLFGGGGENNGSSAAFYFELKVSSIMSRLE